MIECIWYTRKIRNLQYINNPVELNFSKLWFYKMWFTLNFQNNKKKPTYDLFLQMQSIVMKNSFLISLFKFCKIVSLCEFNQKFKIKKKKNFPVLYAAKYLGDEISLNFIFSFNLGSAPSWNNLNTPRKRICNVYDSVTNL